jgi:esterase/lipase
MPFHGNRQRGIGNPAPLHAGAVMIRATIANGHPERLPYFMRKKPVALTLVAGAAILWLLWRFVLLVPSGHLAVRHTPSSGHTAATTLQTGNSAAHLTFAEYIAHVRTMLTEVVPEGSDPGEAAFRAMKIEAGVPFELEPAPACPATQRVALLIHGLTDTPFIMRDIANQLTQPPGCMRVRALLLPGHGTRPGDLLKVRWEQWRDATAYGISSFRGTGTADLYIVGFSTGAALALYHSFNPDQVDALRDGSIRLRGLILLSPAIRLKDWSARVANWHGIYSWLPGLRNGAWAELAPDADYAKYESFAKNAAYQIYRLTEELGVVSSGRSLAVPVLIAASAHDTTTEACGTVAFFLDRLSAGKPQSPASRLILYDGSDDGKQALCDPTAMDRATASAKQISLVSVRQGQIFDMTHVSVPIAPDNPHFGAMGDYSNCVHYKNGSRSGIEDSDNKYRQCSAVKSGMSQLCNDAQIGCGEVTPANLSKGVLRRLTYNPVFENLADEIRQFVLVTSNDR